MKNLSRTLALPFLAILLVFSLSGCCNCANSQAISDLQRRVDELEAQLETDQSQPTNPDQESGVNDPTSATSVTPDGNHDPVTPDTGDHSPAPEDTSTTPHPTTTATPEPTINNYIDEQLKSGQYKSWLSAAGCTDATPEQLLLAAQKCAGISDNFAYARDIAKALATNPSIDGTALAALADAHYYGVVEIAAESKYADSYALLCLAKRCANINDNFICARDIANDICNHVNATDEVVAALAGTCYYGVLENAAKSAHAGETALTRIAERCADIDDNFVYARDIARAIAANCNATIASLQPLANSHYGAVIEIGHNAIDALTP